MYGVVPVRKFVTTAYLTPKTSMYPPSLLFVHKSLANYNQHLLSNRKDLLEYNAYLNTSPCDWQYSIYFLKYSTSSAVKRFPP